MKVWRFVFLSSIMDKCGCFCDFFSFNSSSITTELFLCGDDFCRIFLPIYYFPKVEGPSKRLWKM